MQERCVALDGEDVIDANAARRTDAAEIVAQQIDDHNVLAAILFVTLETCGLLLVFSKIEATRHGAFHRACADSAVRNAEEEFGRERENVSCREVEKSAVGDRLRGRQRGEGLSGRERSVSRDGVREVDLVGVARLDVVLDALNLCAVFVFGDGELCVRSEGIGDCVRRRNTGEIGCGAFERASCVIEDERMRIDTEPGKRELW